jgi:hypothetical protein
MLGRCARVRLLGLLLGLLACGCAGIRTQEVEVYEPRPAQPLAKFLVVGIHENGRVRRLFENAFVAELAGRGVEGVQSYRFIYEERAINVERVLRAVQESGADAVITVRAVDVDLQPKSARPIQRENFEFDLFSQDPERRLLPQRDKVTLRTNVYQAADRHLILSATSRVVGPDSVETIGREVCRETVEYLAQEKLLRR